MGHLLKKSWKNLTDMVPHLKRKKKLSEEWETITKKCFQDLIDMKKFELERKYLVLSLDDINTHLDESEKRSLEYLVNQLKMEREDSGKKPLEGIFVKKSYPFYEDTLKKLEMYVKQQNRKEFTMVSLGGQQMLIMEDINPKRVNRGVCIKVTGKEEFIEHDMLRHITEGIGVVLNMNEYHISSHPIKGDQIMIQVRERHNGFTHFFQTSKTSLQTMLSEVM
ncbi:hypothetical protein CPT_Michonne110 [Citrobacter phage Michonne]|uniref:Uncharacterized protein n=2 Tax=Mooglevirus mordin TaxID=1985305 RepID=A0A0K2CNF3_9CAUD|nr:hypothetical protein CPT_Michonne_gp119 [Citrobacter phage Michonne]YP_009606563.1 hypothetical protein FDI02_gp033 [Citrobacter phage Mordin]AKU44059.1 hypothetical protein CPT_Michonne110 [Citrobacter phage Michonne]ALA06923.1 hypothetical protein Mordin_107 [Citrobacter phage Mordin]AYR00851.1 hypothetical protein CPT_Maleficent_132 [Citrobacter phage Maleficent]